MLTSVDRRCGARIHRSARFSDPRSASCSKRATCCSESLRIVNIRYERGITNELDVALATRELDTLEAQIAPVEAAVSAAEYTLAVLVGEYPENMVQELAKPELIPTMPAPVAAGVPLDLLKRRPDIQQAERELGAATARIGVATADLFPQVALVGSIGSSAGRGAGDAERAHDQQAHLVVRTGRDVAAARLRRSRRRKSTSPT